MYTIESLAVWLLGRRPPLASGSPVPPVLILSNAWNQKPLLVE